MKIIAREAIGTNAISMQSGRRLYELIAGPILGGEAVEVDFDSVELFASPFFNASIGLLIKDININELKEKLIVSNLSPVGKQLLNHVIANAIKFYEKEANADEELQIIIKNAEEH